jgi:hypothetical protein
MRFILPCQGVPRGESHAPLFGGDILISERISIMLDIVYLKG